MDNSLIQVATALPSLSRYAAVVPLSGGIDSAYCLRCAENSVNRGGCVAVFFDYGQSFAQEERCAARSLAEWYEVSLIEVTTLTAPVVGKMFVNRNAMILGTLAAAGARVLYFGTRNLLPLFDDYGDSNWVWAKLFGYVHGVEVRMPCIGVRKRVMLESLRRQWRAWVRFAGGHAPTLYSTEKGYEDA